MKVTLNTNNYINQNKSSAQRPMFKGNVYSSLTDNLANGFAKIAKKKETTQLIDWIAKKNIDVTSKIAILTSALISGFYMYNTAKSKKIEPEQKKPLIINMGLVYAIATIGGILTNNYFDDKIHNFEEFFVSRNAAKMSKSALDICKKGVRPASKLLIFTAMYRYFAPVIATPIANKISNSLSEKKKIDKSA